MSSVELRVIICADLNSGVRRPASKFNVLGQTKQGQHIVLQTCCSLLNAPWSQSPFSAELPLVYVHLLLLSALSKAASFLALCSVS